MGQYMLGQVVSTKIKDGTIINADINAAAEIAMSKLNLAITNMQVAADAAVATSKISGLLNPKCRVFVGSDQIISNNTMTDVAFSNTVFNIGPIYYFDNDYIKVPVAGYYFVSFQVGWVSSVIGTIHRLQISGGSYVGVHNYMVSSSSGIFYQQVSGLMYLEPEDQVTLEVYQDSGGNLELQNGSGDTFMTCIKLF